jgi:hypothetical protein
VLLQEWVLDGQRRAESIAASATIGLAHEAQGDRSTRVDIKTFRFTLDRAGAETALVSGGWRTPLDQEGLLESIRLADGVARPVQVTRADDAVGCERITVETRWDATGRLHSVSEEIGLTICGSGRLESWSSATEFPAGSRTVRWDVDPG